MAEEKSFMQPAIPKFDGHYDHWDMLMENLLRSKEYWNIVERGILATTEETMPKQAKAIEEAKLKDLKAKNYLFQAIGRGIIKTILNKDASKGVWDSMKQKYQGSTKVKRAQLQALRREFKLLGMKESESVNEYFARTLAVVGKMKAQGDTKIDEEGVVEKILRSLESRYNYVVCAIEQVNNVSTLTIDELQSSLIVHEQRMNEQKHKEEDKALKATSLERTRGRGCGGTRGGARGG